MDCGEDKMMWFEALTPWVVTMRGPTGGTSGRGGSGGGGGGNISNRSSVSNASQSAGMMEQRRGQGLGQGLGLGQGMGGMSGQGYGQGPGLGSLQDGRTVAGVMGNTLKQAIQGGAGEVVEGGKRVTKLVSLSIGGAAASFMGAMGGNNEEERGNNGGAGGVGGLGLGGGFGSGAKKLKSATNSMMKVALTHCNTSSQCTI